MDSYEEMIVPEVPKALPNEQLFIYVPIASDDTPGVAKFDGEYFSVDTDGMVSLRSIGRCGRISIPRDQWTDGSPTKALIEVPGVDVGSVIIMLPADDDTRLIANRARLSAYPVAFTPLDGVSSVTILRSDAEMAPEGDMTFVYLILKTSLGSNPIAAIIGVDAYGEGGGTASGVDEDAVKKIINSLLGNVANERQYSADNPPPYPVTSVNGKTGAVMLTIPSKASDINAEEAGAVRTHNADKNAHPYLYGMVATALDRISSHDTNIEEINTSVAERLKTADLAAKLDAYKAAQGLVGKTTTDLTNYYLKNEIYTKEEVAALISAIPKFEIKVVSSLPTANISLTTVYLVKDTTEGGGLYTEYIYVNNAWEELGSQSLDLSGYVTDEELDNLLKAYATLTKVSELIADALKPYATDEEVAEAIRVATINFVTGSQVTTAINEALKSYYTSAQVDAQIAVQIKTALSPYVTRAVADKTYQPAGDYPTNDEMDEAIGNATKNLAPKSSVPTKISQLINDSKYITLSDGDERYEPIKQKLEEMDSEEELYERGDTTKQYIVGGYVYEYAPDEVWTQYTEYNTGLVNLRPPVNTGIKEDNSDLTYRSGVLTSGLIPFSRGWDASGDAIRALSKVVIGTKDPAKIGELKPTSMGAVTTAIGTFHYKTDGSYIGFTKASQFASLKSADGANYADTDTIPLPEDLLLKDKNTSGISSWTSVGYVRVVLGLGTGMTDDEVANLAKNITITVPETYKETRTGKWVNTGEKAYDDEAVREVAEDVAALDVRVTATEGAIAQINEALGGEVTTVANYRAIAFVGDSITYGSGASNYGTLQAGWVGEVMTRCGYDEATSVNLGVSGAGFVQIAPAPSSVTIVDIVNAQSFAAFDDIIVSAGINDWKNTTIALADFWTNLKEVFVKLRTDNKYARLYYQLPYNCKISSWTGSTYDTHYALDYKEGGSGNYCLQHTLATFRQMIVDKINTDEDLKTLGIRIIDYMPLTRNNIDQITGDGLHPNAVGYKIIGKTIAQILNLS